MNAEIFSLCDAATVSGGKLNILGCFDTIGARTFPCQHAMCALATRMRFDVGEEGEHSVEFHFCDPDMRPVMKPLNLNIRIDIPNERSQTHHHIWNILGFEIKGPGEYYFELKVDGQPRSRIPLYVLQAEER
ncbi:MAG: hypothetical protein WCN98_04080 [Verrucomicrobiaceae bacterium]